MTNWTPREALAFVAEFPDLRLVETIGGDLIDPIGMGAVFSDEDEPIYRYMLWRIFDRTLPLLVAVMLNPSTATHERDDPTIRGLVARAKRLGLGGVLVVNCFAFRATEPADMKAHPQPVGPLNDDAITPRHAGEPKDGALRMGRSRGTLAETGKSRMRDRTERFKSTCSEAVRQWRTGTSPLHRAHATALRVGRHLPEQLKRNDPEIKAVVNELYEKLPNEIKKEADNIARGRIALAGYALFLLLYVGSVTTEGAVHAIAAIFSIFYAVAIIFFIVGVSFVTRRAMVVANVTVPILIRLAPEYEDDLERVYGERGLGDVFAPWVRRKRSRIGEAGTVLFKGLMPWDRRRR